MLSNKILIVLTSIFTALVLTIVFLSSCVTTTQHEIHYDKSSPIKEWKYLGNNTYVTVYKLNGYEYLIFKGGNCISVIPSSNK